MGITTTLAIVKQGILETNSGWGRTADGWIYLGYIYTEGQVGNSCMIGNVITQQLNIRSGPSTNYPATGSYVTYRGCTRYVITKSGGFGHEKLLLDLADRIAAEQT